MKEAAKAGDFNMAVQLNQPIRPAPPKDLLRPNRVFRPSHKSSNLPYFIVPAGGTPR